MDIKSIKWCLKIIFAGIYHSRNSKKRSILIENYLYIWISLKNYPNTEIKSYQCIDSIIQFLIINFFLKNLQRMHLAFVYFNLYKNSNIDMNGLVVYPNLNCIKKFPRQFLSMGYFFCRGIYLVLSSFYTN